MKLIISISFILLVSCEKCLQTNGEEVEKSSGNEFQSAHTTSAELQLASRSSQFVTEPITSELASEIETSLVTFTRTEGYPKGFKDIEDVRFTWLGIVDVHTRCAEFGDIFFFPGLTMPEEIQSWQSGVALRRGSNIAYRWEFDENDAEQDITPDR